MFDVTNERRVKELTTPAAGAKPDLGAVPRGPARTLAGLPVGARGRVRSFRCAASLMQRLLEMGLTRGTLVEVIRLAPLGDPMEIRLRGYYLSLRRAEAGLIEVDPEPGR